MNAWRVAAAATSRSPGGRYAEACSPATTDCCAAEVRAAGAPILVSAVSTWLL